MAARTIRSLSLLATSRTDHPPPSSPLPPHPNTTQLLTDYFGADDAALDPNERFLKDYFAKKKWLQDEDDDDDDDDDHDDEEEEDGDGGDGDGDGEDGGRKPPRDDRNHHPRHQQQPDDDEDAAFLERADQFEHGYNFRFEQPGAAQIVGHPRVIEDAVRKKDDKRARKRREKAERKVADEAARREEVKRLKNLKKAEIQDKLLAVQQVAGVAAPDASLVDALLEGDFDPDEYDRRMAKAFGEEYYDEAAAAEEAAVAEDEEAVLRDDRAARLLRQAGALDSDDEREAEVPIGYRRGGKGDDDDDEDDNDDSKAAAAADARASVSQLMEEYYNLDYEGTAGGIKTRFKYREVAPDTVGLTIDEILTLPDKVLNSIASLKHVAAPYREGKLRPNYKALQAVRAERAQHAGKRRRPPPSVAGGGGMRLEREGDADNKPWHTKWKAGGGAGVGAPEQPKAKPDAQAARAASFAPLSLGSGVRAGGGGGHRDKQQQHQHGDRPAKKAKQHGRGDGNDGAAAPGSPSTPALTKAQRKNMKRAMKRAAERQKA
jgi:protein KRI1